MTNKIKKIQIFRHIVQLILFFLLPGIYIMAFSELKTIFQMIINGNFKFIEAFPGLIEFASVIIFTILIGRFFCGWFCAFGTFNDWINIISKRVLKVNFKVNPKVDSLLKYVKYIILFLILFLTYKKSSILENKSPWDAFAQITDFYNVLSNLTIGLVLLILIVIGNIFIDRFFCKYLCPLGAAFTIFSKINIFKINKPNDKCGKCRVCTNNCSMGLKLYKVNSVHGSECINCLKCVEVCPRKNIHVNIFGKNINSTLISSFLVVLFLCIYSLSNFGGSLVKQSNLASKNTSTSNNIEPSTSTTTASNSSSSSNNQSQTKYKDGTYTGTGTGFRGGTTKVSITIKSGKITDIKTISSEDTPQFYKQAENTIPPETISSQSTSVDTVSGATYSSNGLIQAVQNALDKAK